LIYPNDIAGDVEIINGLNHYIGMQTLHAENFIEFTILPYIIGFFAVIILIAGLLGNRKFLYIVFILFVIFGIVAMIDFWRWEYDYGHNLDPNAAIIVPGMAYQPPLIGFKQLLNFGAYSIPDIGGWLFISCGALLLIAVTIESNFLKRFKRVKPGVTLIIMLSILVASCSPKGPEIINLNKDHCASCKMTIADARYASQLITDKGRVYKFDDIICTINYLNDNNQIAIGSVWVADFIKPTNWLNVNQAVFIKSQNLNSPMGGNLPAFESKESAAFYTDADTGLTLNWDKLIEL
jgi:copper chaperone NosL